VTENAVEEEVDVAVAEEEEEQAEEDAVPSARSMRCS